MKKAPSALLGVLLALLILRPAVVSGAPKPNPTPGNDHITGQVTIGPSNPARSVWVIVYDGPTQKTRSLTGDDGRYYIGGLDDKTYTIIVRKQLNSANSFSGLATLPANSTYNIKLPS